MTISSSPSTLTDWPEYLPKRTRSPTWTDERVDVALVVALAGTDGEDFALVRLFGGVVGDDDAGGRLGFLVEAFDDHAIVQRTKIHGYSSGWIWSLKRSGAATRAARSAMEAVATMC